MTPDYTPADLSKLKQDTTASLYLIGESRFAMDLSEATIKASFESLEYLMRQRLKAQGPDSGHARTLAGAIVAAQILGAHAQPARAAATPGGGQ